MPEVTVRRPRMVSFWFVVALALSVPMGMLAQRGPGGAPAAPAQARGGASGKAAAPVDLTGYWVSEVTEDWVERMCPDCPRSGVPQAGGGGGVGGGRGGGVAGGAGGGRGGGAPGAAGGQAAAAAPDPCRVYGAGGSMRLPGRLNITWADDNTLKIDMDSGKQTRLFHFGGTPPSAGEKTLQGYSVASWDNPKSGGAAASWSSLTVVTTNMKGGYLLTSRSTYSENATLTEYFNWSSDFGVQYLTVVAMLADGGRSTPVSSTFKKEPNGSKFSPTGCDIVK